jgi:hypothetical protein
VKGQFHRWYSLRERERSEGRSAMKPQSYRGINYTIEKPRPDYGHKHLYWSGEILFPGKTKDIAHCKNRGSLIECIKREIDDHINRSNCGCDDAELFGIIKILMLHVTNYKSFEYRLSRRQPTRNELHSLVDRICEYTKRLIDVQQLTPDRPGLAAKLRRMTVKHGCTPDEAAVAKEKLRQLLEGAMS